MQKRKRFDFFTNKNNSKRRKENEKDIQQANYDIGEDGNRTFHSRFAWRL